MHKIQIAVILQLLLLLGCSSAKGELSRPDIRDEAILNSGDQAREGEMGIERGAANDSPINPEIFDTKPMPPGEPLRVKDPVEVSYCTEQCVSTCKRINRIEKAGVVTGYFFGQIRALPDTGGCEKQCSRKCK